MKVLWLMNEPLPDLAAVLGMPAKTGGSWMVALSQALVLDGRVELGVASRIPQGKNTSISLGGIQHFTVPAPKNGYGLLRPTADMLRRYQEIVDDFSPDVIHVHGTEWYAGIVTMGNRLGRPTVVSIQGLIDFSCRHLLGGLGFLEILKSRTLRDWILFRGLWELKAHWNKRAAVEREIIRGHSLFIGRTLWDRAHLRWMNPDAVYFHCDEMVRREFFEREWDIYTVNRHTIFAPSASYPLKGFHLLVLAVATLKQEFPDIKVRVPLAGFASSSGIKGLFAKMRRDGYANYLSGLIKRLDVGEHIFPLGHLSAQEMADEMQHAHVFALTSFVENGSMARTEAFIVGVPSIVPLAGGIPSMIDDGRNALGFPTGDEAVLAEQIRRIFLDDDLAVRLSIAGRKTAIPKHSPETIVQRMVEIYEAIVRGDHPGYLEKLLEKEMFHDRED